MHYHWIHCISLNLIARDRNYLIEKRISELEDALIPRPLFAEPLANVVPNQMSQDTPSTSTQVKKVSKL